MTLGHSADDLEPPWSLGSSRFLVKHFRLLLQFRDGARPTAEYYGNLQNQGSQNVFQVTIIDGPLPHGLRFHLERHVSDEAWYDLTVVVPSGDDYMFVDLFAGPQRFSNESIRLGGRPRPCGDYSYDVHVDELDELDINLYILRGIHLHQLAETPPTIEKLGDAPFLLVQDPRDFDGCWDETVDVLVDSKHFHIPKRLAVARLPYIATLLASELHTATSTQLELQIPNASWKSFETLLGILVGGQAYYSHWWWKNDWAEALELIITADFLGYWQLVQSLEKLLTIELQLDHDIGRSCNTLQWMESGFPRLPLLMQACLCNCSHQVLAELCRRCNYIHLEKLLRQHKIVDLKSLKEMICKHVGTLAPLICSGHVDERQEDADSSSSDTQRDTFTTMHFHLSEAQERAAKAEEEITKLKEQLMAANHGWPHRASACSDSVPEDMPSQSSCDSSPKVRFSVASRLSPMLASLMLASLMLAVGSRLRNA